MTRRRPLAERCVAALLLLSVVAACADSASDGASDAGWMQADSTFVAQMIPHHELGMTLIDEATRRSGDVRLRHLVFEMHSYHMTDLELLERWADELGLEAVTSFPGDLTTSEVDELGQYDGVSHDIVWLDLMIRHHSGALEIADAEISGGGVDEAKAMATETRRVQSAEIDTMRELLEELCGESKDDAVADHCR